MDRADISVALYRVAADVGGPSLIKKIKQRSLKTIEAMLETASDIKSPLDKLAIDTMLSAMVATALKACHDTNQTFTTGCQSADIDYTRAALYRATSFPQARSAST
jgi:hypothetical protein